MQKISYYIQQVGSVFINFLTYIGQSSTIILKITMSCFVPPWYGRQFLKVMFDMSIKALPIVFLMSFFTGATFALQIYIGSLRFNAENTLVAILVVSTVRQIGPVILALIIAGRNSSSFAAEISSMQITEQISAMRTLSVNPYKYLAAPKILAAMIALPLLTIVTDTITIFGGYLMAVYKLNFNQGLFINHVNLYLESQDVISGIIKSVFFGYIIALSGCHQGFMAQGSAQEVGKATTMAVVESFILIFITNYIISEFLFIS